MWTWVSRYQNVSIWDFIGVKGDGDGGDNWCYKTYKAPVKKSPPTNQNPVFLQAGCPPVAQPTVSKH